MFKSIRRFTMFYVQSVDIQQDFHSLSLPTQIHPSAPRGLDRGVAWSGRGWPLCFGLGLFDLGIFATGQSVTEERSDVGDLQRLFAKAPFFAILNWICRKVWSGGQKKEASRVATQLLIGQRATEWADQHVRKAEWPRTAISSLKHTIEDFAGSGQIVCFFG